MAKFKDRIQQLRKLNRWTQVELSKKASISSSTIGMYEQGLRTPSLENLEILCDVFNVDMDYLMGRSDITTRILDSETLTNLTNQAVMIPAYWDFIHDLTKENLENTEAHYFLPITLDQANSGDYFGFTGGTGGFPDKIDGSDTLIVKKGVPVFNKSSLLLFITQDNAHAIGQVIPRYDSWDTTVLYYSEGNPNIEILDHQDIEKRVLGIVVETRRTHP